MPSFPEVYAVSASAGASSNVSTQVPELGAIEVAAPVSFGGPGDVHTPEDLLVSSVAACFILSFKAIAAASRLEWSSVQVNVEGTLDSVDRVIQFTGFRTRVELSLSNPEDAGKAERIVAKSEQACFITNSLKAGNHLDVSIA